MKLIVLLLLFDHRTAFVSGRFWKRSSGTKTCVCILGPRQTSDSGTVRSARLGGLVCRSCRTRCRRVWVGPPANTKNDGRMNKYTKTLLNSLTSSLFWTEYYTLGTYSGTYSVLQRRWFETTCTAPIHIECLRATKLLYTGADAEIINIKKNKFFLLVLRAIWIQRP